MPIGHFAGQAAPSFVDFPDPCQNGDAIPARLPVPYRFVAKIAQLPRREALVGRLEFLQAGDVGLLAFEPLEQDRQTTVHPVHVVGGDLHLWVLISFWGAASRTVPGAKCALVILFVL